MGFIEQIVQWLGFTGTVSPEIMALRRLLEDGRRAKRAEHFQDAITKLDQALAIAEAQQDPMAAAVINLHRADVLMMQRQFDQAKTILEQVKANAETTTQTTQLAYVVCSQGTLAQAQDDWDTARDYYEKALQVAREKGVYGAEGRAMGHLADTYIHDGNASYAVHLLREALPKLESSGDIELSSYFVGLLGQALIETGADLEGRQLLDRALSLAEHMEYRTYRRHWCLVLARIMLSNGDYQSAYDQFTRALPLYDRETKTVDRITALCQMSAVCSHLTRYDEALTYTQQAEALDTTRDDALLERLIHGRLGIALRMTGQSEQAIDHLEKAAAAYSESELPERIEIVRNLATAQAAIGQYEAAIATYQSAITAAEKATLQEALAESHRDLGLLYASRWQMQEAIQTWSSALDIYEAQSNHAAAALLRCDIANARRFVGQGQRAIKDIEKALVLLNSIDDSETRGVVLSHAANAYVDQGDDASAEAFFSESLEIAKQLGDHRAEVMRLGNYAWFVLAKGQIDKAEMLLKDALRLGNQLGLKLPVAVHTDNLGLVRDARGQSEAALTLHQDALERVQKLDNAHWQAVIQINLAHTYLGLGRPDDAAPLLESALATGRAHDDVEVIIRSLAGQIWLDILADRANSTSSKLNEAFELARKADMRHLKAEILALHSQQQARLQDYPRATELWEKARDLFVILKSPRSEATPDWLQQK